MTQPLDVNLNEPVFACELTAIEPNQRKEHLENVTRLFQTVKVIREQPDGYALEFELDNDILQRVTRFISLERLCCPFFAFTLEIEPRATSFWLSLTGPEGVKPFIQAELGLKP